MAQRKREGESAAVLNRPYYTSAQAARLLGVPATTLGRWLEGYRYRGTSYPPVIRAEPTGQDMVTWGEFVEAGFLREYRRRGVSLFRELRPFIEELRQRLGVPYPLAHEQPYVHGSRLVVAAQEETGLSPRLRMWVTAQGNQILLAEPAEQFLDKVEFSDHVAVRLFPAGRSSPVVIDPLRSFGVPQVDNIRTEIIAELFRAGELIDQIAEEYDLTPATVEAALRYEFGAHAAAA